MMVVCVVGYGLFDGCDGCGGCCCCLFCSDLNMDLVLKFQDGSVLKLKPGTIPIQLASARCGVMMGDLYMFYVVDTTQLWLRLRIRMSMF